MKKEFQVGKSGLDQIVDVIIPNYNNTWELQRAVNSALIQGSQIGKIFVIDDGSSEEVRNYIIENIQEIDKVEVFFNQHSGLPGVARKFGIMQSNATWIAFLDSDDWWEKGKIIRQLELSESLGASFIATNARIWRDGQSVGPLVSKLPRKLFFKELAKDNLVINSSVLIRRELLLTVGIYASSIRTRAVEDFATWLRVAVATNIYFIGSELVNYTDSTSSIRSLDENDPKIYAFIDVLNWLRNQELNFFKHRRIRKIVATQVKKIIK